MGTDRVVAQPISDSEFVRFLYVGFLNREPDRGGLELHLKRLAGGATSRALLPLEFLGSAEFQMAHPEIRVSGGDNFPGYSQEDLKLFSRFDTSKVAPTPGFLTEWIGSRVRVSSLWSSLKKGRVLDQRVYPLPIPGDYHASAIEWVGLLKAVLAARESFSAMELGAGHGPWLAASAAAARAVGIADLHLCGVEADPGRFELLQRNMEDNDLSGVSLALFRAAVGVTAGRARWPRVAVPTDNAGARPIREGDESDAEYFAANPMLSSPADDFIDVEILAFAGLMELRPRWDLIHIDIQGTELELCSATLPLLTEKARYLVIGTHSRFIDGGLMDVFFRAGWVLENELPMRLAARPHDNPLTGAISDGAQVWRNPRL